MKASALIVIAVLAVPRLASAQTPSISELPRHIRPPESGVALIADFDHSAMNKIPVYLINRSGKSIHLTSQDGDVYLKLEYRDRSGDWKRAQPHQYSWCGNSYFDSTLLDGTFRALTGYQPARGESAKIRFRLYQSKLEVTSNVGNGLVSRDDVTKAANDAMTVVFGDLPLVASVARGTLVLHNQVDHVDPREEALVQLGSGRFERAKAEEILRDVIAMKKLPYSQRARDEIDELAHQPEPQCDEEPERW